MSFQINSDREKITGNKTSILGKNEVTLRSGSGSQEVEIIRAQIDPTTIFPVLVLIEAATELKVLQ